MSPTRRDTLKAAGAASGLAMLGGHAVAQQDTPAGDDDDPGAQSLEEGQAGVRVGHFVSGAPAVNVRLVPSEGTDSTGTDDDIGGSGTDDTNATDDGTDNETGGVGDDNETGGAGDDNASGNASDNDTSEDFQVGDDNESDDNETDGGVGTDDNETDDNETDGGVGTDDTDDGVGTDDTDGEGELIAENVSFGEVSEYANVDAGDYTLQIVEVDEETGVGTDDETDGTGNETGGAGDDNETGGGVGDDNETGGAGDDNASGNASDNDTSEDFQVGDDNESDDNETDGGMAGDNESGGGMGGDNETDGGVGGDNETDDNETDDDMFSGGILDQEPDDDNETDDGPGTTDDAADEGEVIHEEEITVGETFYTVALVGASADEIDVHLLRDYDAAQVRLVHASPDAPGVDVTAEDATMTLFDDVQFGQATEYRGVPPGSYSLTVREEARMNDGEEVGSFDAEFDSGEAYSVYAIGSPEGGEEEFDLVVEQDGQSAGAGLGQDDAPGQQDQGPGEGEPGGPGAGDEEPGGTGQDNETGGPGGDNETGGPDDEPGSSGGAAGPNDENANDTGGAGDDNASDNESDDEDDDGILAF